MNLRFETDNRQLLAHLEEIRRREELTAQAVSLNRTATHVIAKAARDIAGETGLQQKHFKKRIKKTNRASRRNPSLVIKVGLWEIPVKRFAKPRELKRGGVKYKTIGGYTNRADGFVARGNKGETVFHRKGEGRLPLKQITADVGPVMRRQLWRRMISSETRGFFQKTFFKEMDFRIQRSLKKQGFKVS